MTELQQIQFVKFSGVKDVIKIPSDGFGVTAALG
jgi:hypothetical protein